MRVIYVSTIRVVGDGSRVRRRPGGENESWRDGGGSIDYTARSWPDLVFPPMPRKWTDGRAAMRHRCRVERRGVSRSLWSRREERKLYAILGQIHPGTSGRGATPLFLRSHIPAASPHRVGLCPLSLPWSTCNTQPPPVRYGPVSASWIFLLRDDLSRPRDAWHSKMI